MISFLIELDQPDKKCNEFKSFYASFLSHPSLTLPTSPKTFKTPSYAPFCTILTAAQTNPRKNLRENESLAAFIHAIVHIEYCAIDLALDAVYRFGAISNEFVANWLEVANDEVKHFEMLINILKKLGYSYGDFPVHSILFDAMNKTNHSLALRMALIPKTYEANGLDANIKMSDRIRSLNHPLKNEILDALEIIRREEIDHVAKGNKWFKIACENEGLNPDDFISFVEKLSPDAAKKRSFLNIEDRKKAGFTCQELKKLSLKEMKCEHE
jgi:uncharacterized ferritin-like protein (DUF455 family)